MGCCRAASATPRRRTLLEAIVEFRSAASTCPTVGRVVVDKTLNRRRRRQGNTGGRAAGRRLRCADRKALRTRSRAHGRDARQARVDPGLSHSAERCRAGLPGARHRYRGGRSEPSSGTCRPAAVCAQRRHRHGALNTADRHQHHVQEDRRRCPPGGAGREGRRGRLHAGTGRRPRACRHHAPAGRGGRSGHHLHADGDGRAAGSRRRERAGGGRGGGNALRRRAR